MRDRQYRRKVFVFPTGQRECIGHIENGWFKYDSGSMSSISDRDDIRDDVTPEEIAEFENNEKERRRQEREQVSRELEMLNLCGLTHDDFVRFRGCWIEDGCLFVRTRENGIDSISTEAVRNSDFLNRQTDDCDHTYVTYQFNIQE